MAIRRVTRGANWSASVSARTRAKTGADQKGVPTIQEAGRKMGKRVALFAFFCEGGKERDEWMSELWGR